MSDISDNSLVDRVVLHRDRHAFGELVKRYQSGLRYSMRQLTGWNEALADDVVQDAFVKAYTSLPGFNKQAKFSTWLHSIAMNELRQALRKRTEEPLDPKGEEREEQEEPAANSSGNDTERFHRDLARAMATLSLEQRTAVHLHLHQQCTHAEIAEIMNMPLGTIKTHINRGRVKLQQALDAWRKV